MRFWGTPSAPFLDIQGDAGDLLCAPRGLGDDPWSPDGTPSYDPKRIVFIMEKPSKMDDLRVPPF